MNRNRELDNRVEDSANAKSHAKGTVQRCEKRHLTAEARREIRDKIAQWLFTPEPLRVPSTLKQLAQDLHISYSFARYLKNKIPNDLQDYVVQSPTIAVAEYGAIVKTLVEQAIAGNADAAKWIFRDIIHPRNPELASLRTGKRQSRQKEPLRCCQW